MRTSLAGRISGGGRGITLIEMLVVMTIIALLAGLSFPSVSAGLDSVRLRSATDSVASLLNRAANRADRHEVPVEIVISTKDNDIEVYSNEPGFERDLKMPQGITIEAVLPQEPEEEGPRRLLLLPGGAAPGIGIQLANHHGAHRLVRLDPMTGFPRVESVNKE